MKQLIHLPVLAITALTVGIFASFAKAEVIYTKTDVTISGNGLLKIDLNHDGITDVTIVSSGAAHPCPGGPPGSYGSVYAVPAPGNGVAANYNYALALNSGTRIRPTQSFYDAEALMIWYNSCAWPPHENDGDWLNVSNRYLGLRFQIKGHTHYGWARLSVNEGRVGPIVTLTGYAYETIAGQAITTGQTSGP